MTSELLSIFLGIAANLVAWAIEALRRHLAARRKLAAAQEKEFYKVLASDSLPQLGMYLDNAVGQFSVAEYASNAEVRRRVNTFLARLEEFVGKSEDVIRREPARPSREPEFSADVDQEIRAVEERILAGGVWDGLAHLRRTIELRLIDLARRHELEIPSRPGARRLIELLRRNGIGNEDVWETLRYAIDLCNRGVHGLDVSTEEALNAVRYARASLQRLGLVRPTSAA